jgi:hypothetical protein
MKFVVMKSRRVLLCGVVRISSDTMGIFRLIMQN